jgi:hypothetical protein
MQSYTPEDLARAKHYGDAVNLLEARCRALEHALCIAITLEAEYKELS